MERSASWSGLRALWSGLKRILAALAMGLVGAMVCGFTLGLATFFVYAIGLYLGLPLGFAVGLVYGMRMAARDVAIVVATSSAVLAGVGIYRARTGMDSLLAVVVALALASVVALFLLAILPRYVPERVRYALAVPLSILFLAGTFGVWVWRIYSI